MYRRTSRQAVNRTAGITLPALCLRTVYGSLLLVALLLAAGRVAAAGNEQLNATIEHLITFVQESNVTFERNFSSHDSTAAAEHIGKKYQHFQDEIDTPEKFIELCATRSLVTGKDYMVITPTGEKIPAGVWLNTELAQYRAQQAVH